MPKTASPRKSAGKAKAVKALPKAGPADVLDTMGITALATGLGVAPDNALAMAATVLTGIAGPETFRETACGSARLPMLDVLVVDPRPRMQRLVDRLVDPVRLMNQRLGQNMALYNEDVLRSLAVGPFYGVGKNAMGETMEVAVLKHERALEDPDGSRWLESDLEFNPVVARIEAMTHPGLVLTGTRCRELVTATENCHSRMSLLVQPLLEFSRSGPEPHMAVRNLLDLLDGTGSVSRGTPGRGPGPVKAQAIISLTQAELEFVANNGEQMLSRLLWLEDEAPVSNSGASADTSVFVNLWEQSVRELVSLRRQGRRPMARCEAASLAKLEAGIAAHEAYIDGLAIDPGPSARGLPETLYWTLCFLRRSLPAATRPADDSVVAVALKTANTLLSRHCRQLQELVVTRQVELQRLLAEKIATDMVGRPGMKMRDIMRLFAVQRKSRFEGVLRALVGNGVLVLSEAGVYHPGPVDFADAEEALVQGFQQACLMQQSDPSASGNQHRPASKPKTGAKTLSKTAVSGKPVKTAPTPTDKVDKPAAGKIRPGT